MNDQIRKSLIDTYMRGFRAGASGDRTTRTLDAVRRFPSASFARGYKAGEAAAEIGKHQAERFADETLASLEGVLDERGIPKVEPDVDDETAAIARAENGGPDR